MSSDIVYSVNVQLKKNSLVQSLVASGVTADCSAAGISTQTLLPGTNAAGTAAISTASLSSAGLFFARNLSTTSTATVSFGRLTVSGLQPTVELRGGECATGRLAAGDYAAQAAVAGTPLVITIVEG